MFKTTPPPPQQKSKNHAGGTWSYIDMTKPWPLKTEVPEMLRECKNQGREVREARSERKGVSSP